jgi:hypothetical protein
MSAFFRRSVQNILIKKLSDQVETRFLNCKLGAYLSLPYPKIEETRKFLDLNHYFG